MDWLLLPLKNLLRNTRRTLAILFTIALGAGALFSFEGFIKGVLGDYRDRTIHSHYGYGQVSTEGYRGKVFEEPWKHWITDGDTLESFLYNVDGVEYVFPRATFSALVKKGGVTINGLGQGINAEREAKFFNKLNVVQGEMLTTEEDGILLGKGLADALDAKPGDMVTVVATSSTGLLDKAKFKVIGVFHTGLLEFDSRVFRIQLKKAQELLGTQNIETVSLGLRSLDDWDNVATAVKEAYPEYEATPFDILDEVFYKHSVDWLNAQFGVVQIIIVLIVLLGIFNAISAAILERKQEIGNLRANGESVFQVMIMIIIEGLWLAVIGCIVGVGISYILVNAFISGKVMMPPGPGFTLASPIMFSFDWSMIFHTFVLSLAAALIASTLAGLRIARMPISKSLRSH
jgi:putative ABC transport system permease protein